jgi:hypothetical protein
MGYPRANWATVQNISKSLMAVQVFYEKTCDLMKELLLPPPFVKAEEIQEEKAKPSFLFHTILDFVCNKTTQILENDELSLLSTQAISEMLNYFKEKQMKEQKENKRLNQKNKLALLEDLAVINVKFANISDLCRENLKKNEYLQGLKRKSEDLPCKRPREFFVDEPQTEYCPVDFSNISFDEYLSEVEIKSQCISLNNIPEKLLQKCREEPPAASLFLFNLPKSCTQSELLALFQKVYPSESLSLQLLEGKLKGQGFLHLGSPLIASKIKSTFFGFPLKGKPMILQYSKSNNLKSL